MPLKFNECFIVIKSNSLKIVGYIKKYYFYRIETFFNGIY